MSELIEKIKQSKYESYLGSEFSALVNDISRSRNLENFTKHPSILESKPFLNPKPVKQGTLLDIDQYNELFSLIKLDLETLQEIQSSVSIDIDSDLSEFALVHEKVFKLSQQVQSSIGDYKIYSLDRAGATYFSDFFTDLLKIDANFLNKDSLNLNLTSTCLTLPVESSNTIKLVDIVVNSNSNGTLGNNEELRDGREVPRNGNVFNIIDTRSDIHFEYERTYSLGISNNDPLVLDITIKLEKLSIANNLLIEPLFFTSNDALIIEDILVSRDGIIFEELDEFAKDFVGTNKFLLSPVSNKGNNIVSFLFNPREILYIRIKFSQNNVYSIKKVKDAKEKTDALRKAIGIKEISLQNLVFKDTGSITSIPFVNNNLIRKIGLLTTEEQVLDGAEIKHQISLDNGQSWLDISPLDRDNVNIKEVINVNSFNGIKITPDPVSIRYKATITRNKDKVKNNLILDKDLDIQIDTMTVSNVEAFQELFFALSKLPKGQEFKVLEKIGRVGRSVSDLDEENKNFSVTKSIPAFSISKEDKTNRTIVDVQNPQILDSNSISVSYRRDGKFVPCLIYENNLFDFEGQYFTGPVPKVSIAGTRKTLAQIEIMNPSSTDYIYRLSATPNSPTLNSSMISVTKPTKVSENNLLAKIEGYDKKKEFLNHIVNYVDSKITLLAGELDRYVKIEDLDIENGTLVLTNHGYASINSASNPNVSDIIRVWVNATMHTFTFVSTVYANGYLLTGGKTANVTRDGTQATSVDNLKKGINALILSINAWLEGANRINLDSKSLLSSKITRIQTDGIRLENSFPDHSSLTARDFLIQYTRQQGLTEDDIAIFDGDVIDKAEINLVEDTISGAKALRNYSLSKTYPQQILFSEDTSSFSLRFYAKSSEYFISNNKIYLNRNFDTLIKDDIRITFNPVDKFIKSVLTFNSKSSKYLGYFGPSNYVQEGYSASLFPIDLGERVLVNTIEDSFRIELSNFSNGKEDDIYFLVFGGQIDNSSTFSPFITSEPESLPQSKEHQLKNPFIVPGSLEIVSGDASFFGYEKHSPDNLLPGDFFIDYEKGKLVLGVDLKTSTQVRYRYYPYRILKKGDFSIIKKDLDSSIKEIVINKGIELPIFNQKHIIEIADPNPVLEINLPFMCLVEGSVVSNILSEYKLVDRDNFSFLTEKRYWIDYYNGTIHLSEELQIEDGATIDCQFSMIYAGYSAYSEVSGGSYIESQNAVSLNLGSRPIENKTEFALAYQTPGKDLGNKDELVKSYTPRLNDYTLVVVGEDA